MTQQQPSQPQRASAVTLDQWSFTSRFEGVIPHLYLDTVGIPTCGVGFAVRSEAELAQFQWTPSLSEAVADYRIICRQPSGLPASLYKRHTKARLSDESIRNTFEIIIASVRRQLKNWNLDTQPVPVQLALVDMAYNLGVAGLGKYVKMRAAVEARDWARAADECSRRGVQQPRNEATRELFLAALSDEETSQ